MRRTSIVAPHTGSDGTARIAATPSVMRTSPSRTTGEASAAGAVAR